MCICVVFLRSKMYILVLNYTTKIDHYGVMTTQYDTKSST